MEINCMDRNHDRNTAVNAGRRDFEVLCGIHFLQGRLDVDRAKNVEQSEFIYVGRPQAAAGPILDHSNSVFSPCPMSVSIRAISGSTSGDCVASEKRNEL